jgi:hypothetical protein
LGAPNIEGEPKEAVAVFVGAGVVEPKGCEVFGMKGGVDPKPVAPNCGIEVPPKVAAAFANVLPVPLVGNGFIGVEIWPFAGVGASDAAGFSPSPAIRPG